MTATARQRPRLAAAPATVPSAADAAPVSMARLSEQCLAWRDGWLPDGARGLRHRAASLFGRNAGRAETAPAAWTPETIRPHLERAPLAPPPLADAWLDLAAVAPKRMALAWHVTPAGARAAFAAAGLKTRIGGAAPEAFVRFIDVTGRDAASADCHSFDIPVAFAHGRGVHFQEVWTAGRDYVAELRLRPAGGAVSALVARSNRTCLPRDAAGAAGDAADRRDPRWLEAPARPEATDIGLDILSELSREDAARENDPRRDAETEAAVRAVYRNLLTVGPRALRQAPPLTYRSPEECRQAYERRRRLHAASLRRARPGTPAAAAAGQCWIGRLERAAALPAEPLAFPPVRHEPRTDSAAAMAPTTPAAPGRTFPEPVAPLRADFAAARRAAPSRRAPPASAPAGNDAFKTATAAYDRIDTAPAEGEDILAGELGLTVSVVLRGRVRPGRRVRIGGRAVATAADGSFRVDYAWREGMRLPVEVAAADASDRYSTVTKTLTF